jgi:YVTN family beta-propeller protein
VRAVGLEQTRNGKRVFVSLGSANRVAEIDPVSYKVKRYFLVGKRVWHVAVSPDQKRLYTANGNSGDISVVNLEDNEVTRSIPVGRGPWGVTVVP